MVVFRDLIKQTQKKLIFVTLRNDQPAGQTLPVKFYSNKNYRLFEQTTLLFHFLNHFSTYMYNVK